MGYVTGSPPWTPLSGTKWVSLIQLLPKVKFSSLTKPKKKGNIYLSHICFCFFPQTPSGRWGTPHWLFSRWQHGCTFHTFMGVFLSSRLFSQLSQTQNATQIQFKCHLSPKAVPSSPKPIALFLQRSCFKMYLANE